MTMTTDDLVKAMAAYRGHREALADVSAALAWRLDTNAEGNGFTARQAEGLGLLVLALLPTDQVYVVRGIVETMRDECDAHVARQLAAMERQLAGMDDAEVNDETAGND